MYVYIQSEPNVWTAGFYDPEGVWQPESDHGTPEIAAKRVHYLNGDNEEVSTLHQAIIDEIEDMIEGKIFFDYLEKEYAEQAEAVFKKDGAKIVDRIIETLSFSAEIAEAFEEYFVALDGR